MSIDKVSHRREVQIGRRSLLAIPAAMLIAAGLASGCTSQESGENSIESKPEPSISSRAIAALQEASLFLANTTETLPGSQRIGLPSNAPKWGGDSLTPHHILSKTPDREITFSYSTTYPEGTLPDCQTWQKSAGQPMNAPFLTVQQIGRESQDFRQITFTCNQVGTPEVKATIGNNSKIVYGGDTSSNPQTQATVQAASVLAMVANNLAPTN